MGRLFSSVMQCILPRIVSDHSLILLDVDGMQRGHFPFRGMSFEALSGQDTTKLEEPFVEEEVFNALLAVNGDKALANEAIDPMLKSNRSGVLYKLDIQKAYDCVN
ncbi:hypothetical protein CK203_076554 [Vitis vinifera]|uniref:Reverse transcriptase domain-containing protein n=1 Tax=Vitis vinifera TaxID=29760 RepID=A0A438DB10_VITVI|nr:hypothetical protein CK203_076554 [Vitis vinifera]